MIRIPVREAIMRVQAGDDSQKVLESLLCEDSNIQTVEEALKILSQEDADPEMYNNARSYLIAVSGEAEQEVIELLDDLELAVTEDEINSIIEKLRVHSPLEDMFNDMDF